MQVILAVSWLALPGACSPYHRQAGSARQQLSIPAWLQQPRNLVLRPIKQLSPSCNPPQLHTDPADPRGQVKAPNTRTVLQMVVADAHPRFSWLSSFPPGLGGAGAGSGASGLLAGAGRFRAGRRAPGEACRLALGEVWVTSLAAGEGREAGPPSALSRLPAAASCHAPAGEHGGMSGAGCWITWIHKACQCAATRRIIVVAGCSTSCSACAPSQAPGSWGRAAGGGWDGPRGLRLDATGC